MFTEVAPAACRQPHLAGFFPALTPLGQWKEEALEAASISVLTDVPLLPENGDHQIGQSQSHYLDSLPEF